VTPRAVVFDLWQTLAQWPADEATAIRHRAAERIGVPVARFEELWNDPELYLRRESGPMRPVLEGIVATLGGEADVDDVLRWRLESTRRTLLPVPGVASTVARLRDRGLGIGLISNCTEEVPLVWGESLFAPLIDVAIFSATAGCVKPDRRIYELACTELGVRAEECLFVGDGANDELGGAARAGMTPVLIHPPGEEPRWDGLASWEGLRITAIPQVLDLFE
jgi:putative hydrolase of the HAD superfamily